MLEWRLKGGYEYVENRGVFLINGGAPKKGRSFKGVLKCVSGREVGQSAEVAFDVLYDFNRSVAVGGEVSLYFGDGI
jgi:hypothetical protein